MKMVKAKPAWAMVMYRASRTWGSPVGAALSSGIVCFGGSGDGTGGACVDFRMEADRNMSCHAGLAESGSEFGSEYGTKDMG